jgi:hypothetical protein
MLAFSDLVSGGAETLSIVYCTHDSEPLLYAAIPGDAGKP